MIKRIWYCVFGVALLSCVGTASAAVFEFRLVSNNPIVQTNGLSSSEYAQRLGVSSIDTGSFSIVIRFDTQATPISGSLEAFESGGLLVMPIVSSDVYLGSQSLRDLGLAAQTNQSFLSFTDDSMMFDISHSVSGLPIDDGESFAQVIVDRADGGVPFWGGASNFFSSVGWQYNFAFLDGQTFGLLDLSSSSVELTELSLVSVPIPSAYLTMIVGIGAFFVLSFLRRTPCGFLRS